MFTKFRQNRQRTGRNQNSAGPTEPGLPPPGWCSGRRFWKDAESRTPWSITPVLHASIPPRTRERRVPRQRPGRCPPTPPQRPRTKPGAPQTHACGIGVNRSRTGGHRHADGAARPLRTTYITRARARARLNAPCKKAAGWMLSERRAAGAARAACGRIPKPRTVPQIPRLMPRSEPNRYLQWNPPLWTNSRSERGR